MANASNNASRRIAPETPERFPKTRKHAHSRESHVHSAKICPRFIWNPLRIGICHLVAAIEGARRAPADSARPLASGPPDRLRSYGLPQMSLTQAGAGTPGHRPHAGLVPGCSHRSGPAQRRRPSVCDGLSPKRLRYSTENRPIWLKPQLMAISVTLAPGCARCSASRARWKRALRR